MGPPGLKWEQLYEGARLLAKAGDVELGAVFPNNDGFCTWVRWMGSIAPAVAKHKYARSVVAGRAVLETEWQDFLLAAGGAAVSAVTSQPCEAEIERTLAIVTYIVLRHGDVYAPIMERLEAELGERRERSAKRARAQRILNSLSVGWPCARGLNAILFIQRCVCSSEGPAPQRGRCHL